MGIILFAAVVVLLGLGFLAAFIRKAPKTIFRFITIIISVVGALAITLVVKAQLADMVSSDVLSQIGEASPETAEVIANVAQLSPTLLVMLESCGFSVIAPWVFVVLFVLLAIVTWVIYFVVSLILSRPFRHCKRRRVLAGIIGVVQTFIVIMVFMVPVVGYLEMTPMIMNRVAESGILDEDDSQALLDGTKLVEDVSNTPVVKIFGVLGARPIYRACTDIKLEGHDTIHFNTEAEALTKFICDVYQLSDVDGIANYGPEQAEVVLDASVSFLDSELITIVAGEIIYSVTDEWIDGEDFWGMAKPDLGEVVGPFFNDLITVLHDDAHVTENFREDVSTTAKVLSILAQNSTFGHLSDNTSELLKHLGDGNVMRELITTLGQNARMNVLVHDITDIGMRAVATALKVPENDQAIYDGFINNTTELLVTLDQVEETEKVTVISTKLNEEFDRAGVVVDSDIIECFAMAINEDISAMDSSAITPDFLISLFGAYSTVSEETGVISGISYNGFENNIVKLNGKINDGYNGKDKEALKQETFVGAFAYFMDLVTKLPADAPNRQDMIAQAVEDCFGTFLDSMDEEKAATVRVKFNDTFAASEKVAETHQNISSLKSAETVNTQLVTVEDIMKATEGAKLDADNIEKEAESFQNMVSKAGELVELVTKTDENGEAANVGIQDVAPVVGEILNMLKETPTVGSEATEKLFVSIVQTETVRESTGISASDAFDLADGITGETEDYGKAMDTVQVGYDIMEALNSNTLLDITTIEKLINNINTENASVVKNFFTSERLGQYGIKNGKSESTRDMLVVLVDNIAVHDATDRTEDVEAIKYLFNLLVVATGKNTSDENMFGDGTKLGSAQEMIYAILDSQLGQETLIEGVTVNGEIDPARVDAFGVGTTFSDNDKQEIMNTVEAYVADHPDKSLEGAAMLALLGIN